MLGIALAEKPISGRQINVVGRASVLFGVKWTWVQIPTLPYDGRMAFSVSGSPRLHFLVKGGINPVPARSI